MSDKSTHKRNNECQINPQPFKRIRLDEDSFSNKRKNGNSIQLSISNDDDTTMKDIEEIPTPGNLTNTRQLPVVTLSVPKTVEGSGFEKEIELKAWFTDTLRLPQYFDLFYEEGCDSLDSLEGLVEDDLIDVGIRKKGHIKKILREIAKLHQPTSSNTRKKKRANKPNRVVLLVYGATREFDIPKDIKNVIVEYSSMEGIVAVDQLKQFTIGKIHRTIMVIGGTGNGKTTLLNSMMNYLWEVQYDDKFRYKLVYEKKYVGTDDVTAYLLDPPALDYELRVIDTPGFGDCRGIERDLKITKTIKLFFDNDIQDIDAICFVIRAQAWLTATQRYIFSQVLSIFGYDIADKIFILITFSDGKKPVVLEALKSGNVPFKDWFKLNNSAFDLPDNADDDNDMFAKLFWKLGISAFEKLFKSIDQLKSNQRAFARFKRETGNVE